jgi:hypothetical protein
MLGDASAVTRLRSTIGVLSIAEPIPPARGSHACASRRSRSKSCCLLTAYHRLGRPALSSTPAVALPAHIPQMLRPAWLVTAVPLGSR